MKPPIVIDTCALLDKSFWNWIRKYHQRKVLPTIAYTEYCHHLLSTKNIDIETIDRTLRILGIEIACFRHQQALYTTEIALTFGDFKENWRDYMIASFAYLEPWVVVTYNIKHFDFLEERALEPNDIMYGRK